MTKNKIITGNIGDDSISLVNLVYPYETETIYIKELTETKERVGPWDLLINAKEQLLILNSYDESIMTLDLSNKRIVSNTKLGRSPVCMKAFNSNIYILNCDSNSLSILDEESFTIIEDIFLDEKPIDLQIDQDKNMAYIANSNGNSISILDLYDHSIETVKLEYYQPFRIIVDETYVYFLSYINNGAINYSSISTMDKIEKTINSFKIKGIFIDFIKIDDSIFLLTNPDDGFLYKFNILNGELSKVIHLGGMPSKIIWDKKDSLYITDLLNNQIQVFDLNNQEITKNIRVGNEPQGFYLL